MAWAKPDYPRAFVNKAGAFIIHDLSRIPFWEEAQEENHMGFPGGVEKAFEVVNNWRSSHSFPLNTFQIGLRNHTTQIDPEGLVAQRIKRLPAIIFKLNRFPTMTLTEMQDIGGCRAIVADIPRVKELRELLAQSRMKHALVREKDYITKPKDSGYRGIHLVYRYHSDRKTTYNGLQIEVQLRSRPQHIWATAVETVGTLIRQSLKSSVGEEQWLRFFQVMSSFIALREKVPLVPGTPTTRDALVDELGRLADGLQVESRLIAYRSAIREYSHSIDGARWYLLEFYPGKDSVVTGFKRSELDKAMRQYLETEKRLRDASPGSEVVLVSVDSLATLEAAYPSYFADTDEFLAILRKALGN